MEERYIFGVDEDLFITYANTHTFWLLETYPIL